MLDNYDYANQVSGEFEPDIAKLTEIVQGANGETLNLYAKELGEQFRRTLKNESGNAIKGSELSSSQVRSVLYEVQRLQKPTINKIHLLRPKLAYAAGRHGGRVKELFLTLEAAIMLIREDNIASEFENLKNFIEAIVAYHK